MRLIIVIVVCNNLKIVCKNCKIYRSPINPLLLQDEWENICWAAKHTIKRACYYWGRGMRGLLGLGWPDTKKYLSRGERPSLSQFYLWHQAAGHCWGVALCPSPGVGRGTSCPGHCPTLLPELPGKSINIRPGQCQQKCCLSSLSPYRDKSQLFLPIRAPLWHYLPVWRFILSDPHFHFIPEYDKHYRRIID